LPQNCRNRVSEDLKFKNFQGRMPSDPPLKIFWGRMPRTPNCSPLCPITIANYLGPWTPGNFFTACYCYWNGYKTEVARTKALLLSQEDTSKGTH